MQKVPCCQSEVPVLLFYSLVLWLQDEQKVQIKRRTELGGACSIASYVFMIGSVIG